MKITTIPVPKLINKDNAPQLFKKDNPKVETIIHCRIDKEDRLKMSPTFIRKYYELLKAGFFVGQDEVFITVNKNVLIMKKLILLDPNRTLSWDKEIWQKAISKNADEPVSEVIDMFEY